ncbi:MAG: TolC family outer membrane protein [Hyphomicrobiaceae bacterium]|nr:TolC family outer membrane protein [Hyphomicrobiaceae bacterium]
MQNLHINNNMGVAIIAGFLSLTPYTVSAETLESVLANTYRGNPEINAERQKLRAVDEEETRARSGYRPKLNFNADIGSRNVESEPSQRTDGKRDDGGYTVSLTQPIFRGLRTINSIRKADADIYAGREDLRTVEQRVFLNAVTAYVNVIRDRAVLRLRRSNVSVLAQQKEATLDRFQVGEVTKTDVAQSKARYSGAVSELNLAQANLKGSRAVFEEIIGHNPNGLKAPRAISKYLPRSLQISIKRGMDEHPTILAATYREMSATHTVHVIRGELLPEINVEGSFQDRFYPATGINRVSTTTVRGTFKMPLYAGGEITARVRQAKHVVLQRRQDFRTARRRVRADVIATWGRVVSTKAKLIADMSQVSANRTALDGVREEEKVGQRTVLNVLDAQQELLDSQVTLAITRRDLLVARYSLLAATGRLSAVELGIHAGYYDPKEHYGHVRRKRYGTRVKEYNDSEERRIMVGDRYFPASLK